ncbi:MAG: right-handed parallel beta-helix repeat-containing protein, partial [Candidatus Thorarchaeota archaeon]
MESTYIISCYNLIIENCTISGKTTGIDIAVWSAESGITVNNCTVYNCDTGIELGYSDGIIVNDCNIYSCDIAGFAIYTPVFSTRSPGLVSNNRIHDMTGHGIYLSRSGGWTLQGNTVDNCGGWSTAAVLIEHIPTSSSFITQCTVKNSYTGVKISGSQSVRLAFNDVLDNSQDGIFCVDSNYTMLENNDVIGSSWSGISLSNSNDSIVEYNYVYDSEGDGISIADSSDVTVQHNTFDSNGGLSSELSAWDSLNLFIFDNDFTNNKYMDGVYLRNCDYANITENRISGHQSWGLYLQDSEFCVVHSNTIEDNGYTGIFVFQAHNNTLSENTMKNCSGWGIRLYEADNNSIESNAISNNTDSGIFVDNSDNAFIFDNEAFDNGWTYPWAPDSGIHVFGSQRVEIRENRVYNNTEEGVSCHSSNNVTIVDNEIYGNWGMEDLGCGVYASSANDLVIVGNTVYNNTDNGLYLVHCDDAMISENVIYKNTLDGIHLVAGGYGVIDENAIYGNGADGVYTDSISYWNLTWNIVYDNGLYGIEQIGAANNLIYYNDIGWNGIANGYANTAGTWNTTDRGNWWHDFNETEGPTYNVSTGVVDHFPHVNLIAGYAAPVSYEKGTPDQSLTWTASALHPTTYAVYINGGFAYSNPWDGSSITVDVSGLDVGHYDYMVFVYHVSGRSDNSSSYVDVYDTTDPSWVTPPSDQEIELGTMLSYLLEVTDFSGVSWSVNDTVHFTVTDGLITNNTVLDWGDYGLNVTAVDAYSNSISHTIRIRVRDTIAPFWVNLPEDLTITEGSSVNVNFYAHDLSDIGSWSVDDEAHFSIAGGVLTNTVDLEAGTYDLTITVVDLYGNSNSTGFR